MFYAVEEKRLNEFKQVHCVTPKDLFKRLGSRVPESSFPSSEEEIPMNLNKIESIEYLEKYDDMKALEQSQNNASECEEGTE